MEEKIRFEKFLKNIGKNLRAVRVAQKKEIQTVAHDIGIEPALLEKIENGDYNWDIELLGQLCRYYNVSVREFVRE